MWQSEGLAMTLGLGLVLCAPANTSAAEEDVVSYSVMGTVTVEVEVPTRTAPPPQDPVRVIVADGQIHTLERVFFVSGGAEVRSLSLPTLDAVAVVMITAPHIRVLRIEAHTDTVAGDNLGLSQRRAEWVRAYLVKKGVAAERLVAAGFGDTRPIAPNDTVEGRQQHRRVEFIIGS